MAKKPIYKQEATEDFRFTDMPQANTSTSSKPYVPGEMRAKWQKVVDVVARILGVPAGLIMKVDPPQIEVYVASSTEANPYKKGERADLNTGLYCETVIAQRSLLLVPNALKDPEWDHNPDIELDMIFYLGFPLQWPDGEIFGTICVLDVKENLNAVAYQDLLLEFKEVIKTDLKLLVEITERKKAEEALQRSYDELEKRVEERTAELSKVNEELKNKTINLEEANTALKVLLEKRDEDKIELEEKVLSNVKELTFPYIENLKMSRLDDRQMGLLGIIESNLNEIIMPFLRKLSSKYSNLTPKEIQVAGLVKEGKTSKEIAELLDSSKNAVEFHRRNLRKKLGIRNTKTNLSSYLLSLP